MHWQRGDHNELTVAKNRHGQHRWTTPVEIEQLLPELARPLPDPDVVAWFKQQAGRRGYQTLINAALRDAMQQKPIENRLRRVIREELHSA